MKKIKYYIKFNNLINIKFTFVNSGKSNDENPCHDLAAHDVSKSIETFGKLFVKP